MLSVSEGEPGLLNTTSPFADFRLKFDFRRAREDQQRRLSAHRPPSRTIRQVDCYELNIAAPDVSPLPTGSFARRQKASRVARRAPTNGRASK